MHATHMAYLWHNSRAGLLIIKGMPGAGEGRASAPPTAAWLATPTHPRMAMQPPEGVESRVNWEWEGEGAGEKNSSNKSGMLQKNK